MADYILTDGYSFPSARLLRDSIQKIVKNKILVTSHSEKIRMKDRVIVRYGNSERTNGRDVGLNLPELIVNLSNKYHFSSLLNQHGLTSPEFHREGKPENYPVLIRTTLSSSGGRGIILCEDEKTFKDNWRTGYWWTPFYPTEYELRAHVINGNISRIFVKEREAGEVAEKYPIRNLHKGYHFSLRNTTNNYMRLKDDVTKINEILPRESFYALDAAWDKINKRYIIWEGNSAPGLNENTADFYASYLARYVYGIDENELDE